MSVLARLRARVGSPRARFGKEVRAAYLDARRVATQLRSHATRVPYPNLGVELRRLADQADSQAATLADELRRIAGNADPTDPVPPREGRNHWERLRVDLTDLDTLKQRYIELALHWDVEFPTSATTFARLGRSTAGMSATIRAMVARSDPHAA